MSPPDANEVVYTQLSEDGVGPCRTRGEIASYVFRRAATAFLRELDHGEDFYAVYREIKHPRGEGSVTPSTRLKAHDFAMKTASLLAILYAEDDK